MRAPMARAVIGGLITSTMLTLVVVPVAYTYIDDFGAWARRRFVSHAHLDAPVHLGEHANEPIEAEPVHATVREV